MSSFQSSNPTLTNNAFTGWRNTPGLELGMRPANVMTVQGAINTTMILTGLMTASAVGFGTFVFNKAEYVMPGMLISIFGGLILGLIMAFKPMTARFLAVPYAIIEGAFVAGVSLWAMVMMKDTKIGGSNGSGVVFAAAGGTIATLVSMLGLYKLNIVRNTPLFGRVMMISGVGLCVFALGALIASLFGVNMSAIYGNGPLAIAITGVFLVYSAFCFILDFDLIEQGAAQQAPKALEWYAGYSLLVTIVMVYYYILRLLVQLFGRRE